MPISVRVPGTMNYYPPDGEMSSYGGTFQVVDQKIVFLTASFRMVLELSRENLDRIADALKANLTAETGLQPRSDAARAALAVEQSRTKEK